MDKDLQSVQEARDLIERAHAAFLAYRTFSQSRVDAVVEAMAAAAAAAAEPLARLAVEETTYGKVADKVQKNLFAAERVYAAIRGLRTVGVVREDGGDGVLEIAVPVGVVAAVLPCTNPTSTAIYKILIALKAGNAIVVSPHPAAMRCICETVGIMERAARAQGAPAGLIGCFSTPTLAGTQELMRHRRTGVILATGGASIVRAAYSSGKPAFGVGPGNVPVFVDRSADLPRAIADAVAGKTFDWGTICSSEQAIIAEADLREPIVAELRRQGAYFLDPEESRRLGDALIRRETFTVNPQCVGQSPQRLGELAGVAVPAAARVLVAEPGGIGKEFPLSAEKLSPVLALFFAADRAAGFDLCARLLRFGGLGHTCVIHARDEAVIREYGLAMPAFRVVVNSPAPQGSIGLTTNLFPAMTLGCGAAGGNITSDNIGPRHLLNLKRVAKAVRSAEVGQQAAAAAGAAPFADPVAASCACPHAPEALPEAASAAAGEEMRPAAARAAARAVVERFLAEKLAAFSGAAPAGAAISGAAPLGGAANVTAPAASGGAPPAPAAFASSPGPASTASSIAAGAGGAPAAKPTPRPEAFVCEDDVRAALRAGGKILISAKTILTPSARDLGNEHAIFVEVAAPAAGGKKSEE